MKIIESEIYRYGSKYQERVTIELEIGDKIRQLKTNEHAEIGQGRIFPQTVLATRKVRINGDPTSQWKLFISSDINIYQ